MKSLLPFLIISISLSLICSCTISPTAGGTSDTGNSKIAAVIYANNGRRASGASVTLVSSKYLSSLDTELNTVVKSDKKKTTTDESGYFSIDSIKSGDYCIEINDNDSSAVLRRISISQSADSTFSLSDTLHPYGKIKGNVGGLTDTSIKRYLLIYGLDRCIQVANDGTFSTDDLPSGTYNFKILADNDGWIPMEIDSVEISSGQTVVIPFAGWKDSAEVTLNTTSSGANISGNVYGFPVLIRLSEDKFNFSEARGDGSDLGFFKSDGTPIQFAVEQWDSIQKKACIWVNIDTVKGNDNKQSFTMIWGNPNVIVLSNRAGVFDTSEGFSGIYHFGGNLDDATAHMFNGKDNKTADVSGGIIGHGRSFDGASSYISLGDLPDRPAGTISFWFRPGVTVNYTTTKTQGIWGKEESNNTDFTISLQGSDFYSGSGSPGNLISKQENPDTGCYMASTTSSFSAGAWYFATWGWNPDSNFLYINGALESSTAYSRPVLGNGNDEIGRSLYDSSNIAGGGPLYFNGTLDEFRIENTFRGAEWIKLCYMNQRANDKLVTIKK